MTTTIAHPNNLRERFNVSDRTIVISGLIALVAVPYPLTRLIAMFRFNALMDIKGFPSMPARPAYFESFGTYTDWLSTSFLENVLIWVLSYVGAIALIALAVTSVWTFYQVVLSPLFVKKFTLQTWKSRSSLALGSFCVAVAGAIMASGFFFFTLPPV